ncbi:MAG: cation:proton antiporter [Candidatus Eremiobacteraeota bacterium]|nr:cation:proton antiporter [Candidatus Eremiobacteraeota bacterium]
MKVTFVAPLLAIGILVGSLRPGLFTQGFGYATLWIFLPALLFDAAWELDWALALRLWKPIVLLAVPGVAVTAAVIAAAIHFAGQLPWAPALLLGSILSATDPIAVVALFRTLGVPAGLLTIVECESLLNDAIAVVLYRILLVGAVSATAISASPPILGLLGLFGSVAGIATGFAIAYPFAQLLSRRIGIPGQAIATFAGAYGAYYAAEHVGFSGIFAVIAFGAALQRFERKRLSPGAMRSVGRAWRWAVVGANAALFFLIGSAVDVTRLLREPRLLLVTLGAVALARILATHVLLGAAVRPALPPGWLPAIRLAGVRGALALALGIALPASVPFRGAIVDAIFCVVVVTIVGSALTLKTRLRRLGLFAGE